MTFAKDPEWLDTFICQFQMEDHPCFEQTIERSKSSSRWQTSTVKMGEAPSIRDSQQIGWGAESPAVEHEPFLSFAQECLESYMDKLPASKDCPDFGPHEGYNLICYKPGQAYHGLHADRWPTGRLTHRYLTFVMYLNTIEEGGEIEFPMQGVKVKPVTGRALIHPPDWCFAHKTYPCDEDRFVFNIFYGFPKEKEPSMLEQYGID